MLTRPTLLLLTLLATSSTAFAGTDKCKAGPKDQWQPMAALEKKLTAEGWKIKKAKIDDGCYEVYGTDPQGKQAEIHFHPKTFDAIRG